MSNNDNKDVEMLEVVYLAGPYTHDDPLVREERYHGLLKAEAYLLRKGYAVISPINMCHEIGKTYGFNYGYDYWQSRDRTLITKCDKIVVLTMDGYARSVGVKDEVYFAKTLDMPVEYLDLTDVVLDVKIEESVAVS